MRRALRRPAVLVAASAVATFGAAFAAVPGGAVTAGAPPAMGVRQQVGQPGDESADIRSANAQFYGARSAPGNIKPGAYTAAYDHVQSMGVLPAAWSEVTTKPYNADSPQYRDLVASNSSGGGGFVTGRVTGVAVDGPWIYAGGAQGGVFRSSDEGASWTPISDGLPALATGDLALAPDGSLWLATGEADFGDGLGSGVYRLASPRTGVFTRQMRVGGTELESHSVAKLEFDRAGKVYAATSRGLYRHSATVTTGAWELVQYAVAQGSENLFAFSNITNDVVVRPGTQGKTVLSNLAWRAGAAQNGFYVSTTGGGAGSFTKVSPTGAINTKDIGIADLAYSSDGKKLYVVLESPAMFNNAHASSTLAGVFVSPNGDPAGPYTQIASPSKLASSGSALGVDNIGQGYAPGVQAWYNRFVAVDPNNRDHVFVGLEEVYETKDGGTTWSTVGRYWDFGLKCWSYLDSKNTCDGNVIHPDQHDVAIGNGRLYAANDGGLFSRPLSTTVPAWKSLSESGQLGTLQYYSVGVGKLVGESGVAVWGGLQDNGVSLQRGAAAEMVSPFGGDGGDQIVDPQNGCNTVGEYVYLHLQVTNNCGQTDGSTSAIRSIDPLDPNAQFIAPIAADPDGTSWVAGGQFVWKNTKTWASTKGSDWTVLGDNGDFGAGVYHSSTAIASQNGVVWSGWCGPCSSSTFKSGINTTYGTNPPTLHPAQTVLVDAAGKPLYEADGETPKRLPSRYVAGITVDPKDPTGATAYAVYNGFSAHWVEGPGAGIGHVFRTRDGGATWTDVSGSSTSSTGLPDVPASHLAIWPDGTLVLTTDVGMFASPKADGTWLRLGTGFPYTISTDVRVGPDGSTYVATFGRGIWKTATPAATSTTGRRKG